MNAKTAEAIMAYVNMPERILKKGEAQELGPAWQGIMKAVDEERREAVESAWGRGSSMECSPTRRVEMKKFRTSPFAITDRPETCPAPDPFTAVEADLQASTIKEAAIQLGKLVALLNKDPSSPARTLNLIEGLAKHCKGVLSLVSFEPGLFGSLGAPTIGGGQPVASLFGGDETFGAQAIQQLASVFKPLIEMQTKWPAAQEDLLSLVNAYKEAAGQPGLENVADKIRDKIRREVEEKKEEVTAL